MLVRLMGNKFFKKIIQVLKIPSKRFLKRRKKESEQDWVCGTPFVGKTWVQLNRVYPWSPAFRDGVKDGVVQDVEDEEQAG